MVASTPQPPSGGMVGKKELLQWASQASGRIVTKFDELKDGDVLLRCMKETWPAAYDRCRRKGQPRSVSGNFELMGNMFDHLELPKSVLDTRGIQHASFKSCYNFLVMAFFLKNLATHSDFSVDFTHPVDSKLAAFLQAPESVASLHKGGALAPEEAPRNVPRAPSSARSRRGHPEAAVRSAPRPRRRAGVGVRRGAQGRGRAREREANRRALLAATSTSPRTSKGGRRRVPGRRPLGTEPGTTRTPRRPRRSRAGRSALQQARTRAGSRRTSRGEPRGAGKPRRRGSAPPTRSSAAAGRRAPPVVVPPPPADRRVVVGYGTTTGTWLRAVPPRRTRLRAI